MDTDTQAEEKRRGMTIDIGFAFLTGDITLVDVPGHDRLVKNMVRGVAGIQMGLLVVAADDGVMPQTREHFQILRQLGVPRLLVALSKIDLAEDDWIALVEDDIATLLEGTPLGGSPIFRVSALTGAGIPELREALTAAASDVPPRRDRGFFRLAIDRAFTLKGFGAVVTGTVISGGYQVGEALELVPGGLEVKVRGLQSHGQPVGAVRLGDRAAVNISNLSTAELERGEQLATPGFVATPNAVAALLTLLPDAPPLKHNHPVRLNVGTAEVMARIKLPDRQKLRPGETVGVIFDLAGPTPMVMGDAYVLRSYSPVTTLGGGTILDISLPPSWKLQKAWVATLATAEESQRLAEVVAICGPRPGTLDQVTRRIALHGTALDEALKRAEPRLELLGGRWLVTAEQLQTVTEKLLAAISGHHRQEPYSGGINREALRQQVDGDDKFIEWLLKDLVEQERLQVHDELWARPDFRINLSASDAKLLENIITSVRDQGLQLEYLEEWAARLKAPEELARTLAAIAEEQGQLVRITPRLLLHSDHLKRLLQLVDDHFDGQPELSVADLKTLTGTSRKQAVPLLEYLDRTGRTVRVGDKRVRAGG